MSVGIVLNPSAGGAQRAQVVDQIRALRPDARLYVAQNSREVPQLTRQALAEQCRVILAGGGDGTIRSVAHELTHGEATLGVLPLGTRNHIAQDLSIPLDLPGALNVLISGEARPLDVGDVNGRTFLLYAALGLYPLFVRERERHEESTGRHSLIAYARALWSTLRRFPNLTVRLSADQQVAVSETPFVFVTNRIGMTERLPFGTVTCPQMGQLGIYTAHRADRMGLLRLLAHMRFAPLQEAVDLQAACAGEVLIETRQRHVWLAADGEVMRVETPLRVTLRSRALSVLMPAAVAEPARTS